MGQNASMEGHPLTKVLANEVNAANGGTDQELESKPAAIVDDSSDSDVKNNSVRAAIDSLIETCLGVKSDDSDSEGSKKEGEITPKSDSAVVSKEEDTPPPKPNSVDVVFSFMKERIADMIKNDETPEVTSFPLSNRQQNEEKALSVKTENSAPQPVSDRANKPVKCNPVEQALPKNTMRLQTLIDKVLDKSLGEDGYTTSSDSATVSSSVAVSLPKTTAPSTQSVTSSANMVTQKEAVAEKKSTEIQKLPNNMVSLIDHIERVLERTMGSEETSPEPVASVASVPAITVNTSGGSITQGRPVVTSSGGTEGNVSVQDIVNRVISQTEMISKLLSPNSQDGSEGAHQNHTGENNTGGSRPRESDSHRSSSNSSSYKSQSGYSRAVEDRRLTTHVDHAREWNPKHQDSYPNNQQKLVSSDKGKDPKMNEMAHLHASIAKQNEAFLAQHYAARGLSPHLNGAIPRHAMVHNQQMFLPHGHSPYLPARPFPPPLMRADGILAVEGDHGPTKGCGCVHCVTYFHMEEKVSKSSKQSPSSSPHMMPMSLRHPSALYQHPIHASPSHNLMVQHDAGRRQSKSPNKPGVPSLLHSGMMPYRPNAAFKPVKPVSHPVSLSQRISSAFNPLVQDRLKSEHREEDVQIHDLHLDVDRRHNVDYIGRQEYPIKRTVVASHDERHSRTLAQRLEEMPHSRAAPPGHIEHSRPQIPVLDLSVKDTVSPHATGPLACDPDQPLDLSKKPSRFAKVPLDLQERDTSRHRNRLDTYSAAGSHLVHHLETSVDKFSQRRQGCTQDVFKYNDSVPDLTGSVGNSAVMAPTAMSGIPGGHRPQLHPIPAPTFSTTPSSIPQQLPVRPANQVSASNAQGTSPYTTVSQETSRPTNSASSYLSQPTSHQLLRESPQSMLSPQGLDKGDSIQRRGSVSRHEPIHSIIGNHPTNDILYLICRLCRQTYGSPYGFRKHFRNQHGFEPRAEHTIVQTISATKSAMQGPYALGMAERGVPTGRSSAPPERENFQVVGPDVYRNKKESISPVDQRLVISPSQQDWTSKSKVYKRGNDLRPRSALREDNEDTKYLECPECKQTFQLNDFGSYKRHCRQHNQTRVAGPFVNHESHIRDHLAESEKLADRTITCRFCGCQVSSIFLEEHIKSAHCKEINEVPVHQPMKSGVLSPASPDPKKLQIASIQDYRKFISEPVSNPNLKVQRLPADQITVSASPDSSSDKHSQGDYCLSSTSLTQVSSHVPDTNTNVDSRLKPEDSDKIGDTAGDAKSKDLVPLQMNVGEDDKDSGFSGDRCSSSDSRSLSIESAQEGASLASPADGDDPHSAFYRHKKFGGHRKRKESSENQEPDPKIVKLDQSQGANSREDSPAAEKEDAKVENTVSGECNPSNSEKDNVVEPPKKLEPRAKQEARHQLPFVWDRVTRIQAGKNIKPPDYMT